MLVVSFVVMKDEGLAGTRRPCSCEILGIRVTVGDCFQAPDLMSTSPSVFGHLIVLKRFALQGVVSIEDASKNIIESG